MTENLPRVTQKIFGENTETNIGQFGSAKNGSPTRTGDIEQIQALSAWGEGWNAAVIGERDYPALEEMTGVQKVFSQQLAYYFQKGFPEWDAATTYFKNVSFCQLDGIVYQSLTDNNTGNNPSSDTTNWVKWNPAGGTFANTDLSNLSQTGQDILDSKLDDSRTSNCILGVTNGLITVNNYSDVAYVNKDCSVSGNVASGFGASAYILLNKVFTNAVNFTFEIPFKLNTTTGIQYIARINNDKNGFGVQDGVLFLTYDGEQENGTIQLQPNIDYTVKLERISAQRAYVVSLKTTGDYEEHIRVVSPSGYYGGKSVFLGGGSANFLDGTINLAGVSIKEGSSNYWTISSTSSFQTVTVQGQFDTLMPDGLNTDKTLKNQSLSLSVDQELLYSPADGVKTVLLKNDGEVMIRTDYEVSDTTPDSQSQGGVWYNPTSNVIAEQSILYPNLQFVNPTGGAAPSISNGILNITANGQYADIPGTVTLGSNWDISLVLTGEPSASGYILGDGVVSDDSFMPEGIGIGYDNGTLKAYFRRNDVFEAEKETILSTAYLVSKDSGVTTGYVSVQGEAETFVTAGTPVYSNQEMTTILENAAADTWTYSGSSVNNIETTTGYVKESGTGSFIAPSTQVYSDANCTVPLAVATGTDYQYTGETAPSLIGTLSQDYTDTVTLSYNGIQYTFGDQTLSSSEQIKENCNITLGGISSGSASALTGINLNTSSFSFWEWNGSSIDTPSYLPFVGAKIGTITDNGSTVSATDIDAPLVLAKEVDVPDRNLSNLTYQGTQRFLSNQQLSNYIKYSPKRVTCKLDADGTFRALAGSTFIIPNGFNEDGSRRFDYVTSTKDSVRVQEAPAGPEVRFLFFQTLSAINSGVIGWRYNCVSGAFVTSDTQPQTTPGVYKFWYDTTNNRIRVYSGLTNTWNTENLSLPFAMIYCDLPSGTTVDYSFTEMNGVHWFGNTVFLDKDVTMLCSNYKDPETGVLKSIEYTTDNVYYASRTLSDNYTYYPVDFYFNIASKTFSTYASVGSGSSFYGAMSPKAYSTTGTVWYNLNNNRYRVSNSGEQTIYDADFVYIGTFLMDLEKGCLFPITAAGTTTPLATYNDVYRLPSYYGWYSMTYHNTTGTAGYRLYFYDAGFRYMAFGIQWGYLTGGSGTVNLYHPFSFPNYHISLTYKASANQGGKCRTATVLSSTASSFQVGYLDSGSVTVQQGVRWVAIGC